MQEVAKADTHERLVVVETTLFEHLKACELSTLRNEASQASLFRMQKWMMGVFIGGLGSVVYMLLNYILKVAS